MDTWDLIDAERSDLTDLAGSLTPAQWDAPSLCTAWKVRDVVAHVTQGATMRATDAVKQAVKYGFRVHKLLTEEAQKDGAAPTAELVENLRATIGRRSRPPGVKLEAMLADEVVHQQDIRRAISVPRHVPHDRVLIALDDVARYHSALMPTKQRIKGLHLAATDLVWESGDDTGAEVSGPAEALLMTMAGRPAALGDLSGPGVDVLRERITE